MSDHHSMEPPELPPQDAPSGQAEPRGPGTWQDAARDLLVELGSLVRGVGGLVRAEAEAAQRRWRS